MSIAFQAFLQDYIKHSEYKIKTFNPVTYKLSFLRQKTGLTNILKKEKLTYR
jgi:hypothetical protein